MASYDYDVVVLGAGAAGLTASGFAAAFGAKTALIENARTGGECTWTGCIPSKALIKAARVAHTMRTAEMFGIGACEPAIDFARVMESVRSTRQRVYEDADAPERIASRNIDLIMANPSFVDPHTLLIEGDETRTISARYFIICTGSSPVVPHVPGLPLQLLHTNNSIFEISELPGRLLVIGAGPVGVEMAQAFRRFGSAVAVVDRKDHILCADEPECAALVQRRLEAEGIAFRLGNHVESVTASGNGYAALVSHGEQWMTVNFDVVLAAAGRRPNVHGLALEAAGVAYNDRGIAINHSCQTSASHIYACGDVTDGPHFTHVAEDMARTAATRLLLKVPAAYERRSIPWVTFTDPELAHLGQTSVQLEESGVRYETIRFPYSRLDRSLIDRTDDGVVMVHISPVSGKILGAHIAGECAGEMINEFALAMHRGLSIREISGTVHAYPTYTLGVRRVSDQWYVRQGSPRIVDTVRSIFGYRGRPMEGLGTTDIV
ncbi:MAG: NAD(P)/FAD-dependent oxidoreductase [Bacteroidetes bacterium]|nr:NAD(P)/FAD-dependent oxidoreductase [Bacteroidota bacterium]